MPYIYIYTNHSYTYIYIYLSIVQTQSSLYDANDGYFGINDISGSFDKPIKVFFIPYTNLWFHRNCIISTYNFQQMSERDGQTLCNVLSHPLICLIVQHIVWHYAILRKLQLPYTYGNVEIEVDWTWFQSFFFIFFFFHCDRKYSDRTSQLLWPNMGDRYICKYTY